MSMGKRIALVVGNSGYRFTTPLTNPVNDARAVEEMLKSLDFKVIGGARKGLDLDYGNFASVLRDFGRATREAQTALFFYAGHGLQVYGRNFLVPVDAALEHEGDVHRELIDLQSVLADMGHNQRTSLVFLDACRNNPLAKNLARTMGLRSAEVGQGLSAPQQSLGTFIAFATNPDHIAYDGEGNHGYFTQALLDAMNTHPLLEVRQLMTVVRRQVLQETQNKDRGPQIPWDNSALLDDFYFVRATQQEAASQRVETPAYIPPSPGDEKEAWDKVKDSEDADHIALFLNNYANGEYAYIAKPLLERLLEECVDKDSQRQQQKVEREQLDRIALKEKAAADEWKHVSRIATVEAYKGFAKRHLGTYYFEKVKAVLGEKGVVILREDNSDRVVYIEAGSDLLIKDHPKTPEMVLIPPGKFLMGSPENEKGRTKNEGPQHEVAIKYPFAVSRFAITFNEWDYYVHHIKNQVKHQTMNVPTRVSTGWERINTGWGQEDASWGRGNRPVINVSWHDVQGYLKWLSETTGEAYRLLSESEWEYVCRAGTTMPYWWGNTIIKEQAQYGGWFGKTVPVDSFAPNPWGLYNIHGNVWEWCEDSWHDTYRGAPQDGSAWVDNTAGRSVSRVLRGGSWSEKPKFLRSTVRKASHASEWDINVGFRVARMLI